MRPSMSFLILMNSIMLLFTVITWCSGDTLWGIYKMITVIAMAFVLHVAMQMER